MNLGLLAKIVGSRPLIFAQIVGSKSYLFASQSDLVCGPLQLGRAALDVDGFPVQADDISLINPAVIDTAVVIGLRLDQGDDHMVHPQYLAARKGEGPEVPSRASRGPVHQRLVDPEGAGANRARTLFTSVGS